MSWRTARRRQTSPPPPRLTVRSRSRSDPRSGSRSPPPRSRSRSRGSSVDETRESKSRSKSQLRAFSSSSSSSLVRSKSQQRRAESEESGTPTATTTTQPLPFISLYDPSSVSEDTTTTPTTQELEEEEEDGCLPCTATIQEVKEKGSQLRVNAASEPRDALLAVLAGAFARAAPRPDIEVIAPEQRRTGAFCVPFGWFARRRGDRQQGRLDQEAPRYEEKSDAGRDVSPSPRFGGFVLLDGLDLVVEAHGLDVFSWAEVLLPHGADLDETDAQLYYWLQGKTRAERVKRVYNLDPWMRAFISTYPLSGNVEDKTCECGSNSATTASNTWIPAPLPSSSAERIAAAFDRLQNAWSGTQEGRDAAETAERVRAISKLCPSERALSATLASSSRVTSCQSRRQAAHQRWPDVFYAWTPHKVGEDEEKRGGGGKTLIGWRYPRVVVRVVWPLGPRVFEIAGRQLEPANFVGHVDPSLLSPALLFMERFMGGQAIFKAVLDAFPVGRVPLIPSGSCPDRGRFQSLAIRAAPAYARSRFPFVPYTAFSEEARQADIEFYKLGQTAVERAREKLTRAPSSSSSSLLSSPSASPLRASERRTRSGTIVILDAAETINDPFGYSRTNRPNLSADSVAFSCEDAFRKALLDEADTIPGSPFR